MNEVTRILSALDAGDPRAAQQLLPLVSDELRRLAAAQMAREKPGQTLDATALVHEAYLRLAGSQSFDSRSHFFAAAAPPAGRRPGRASAFPTWAASPRDQGCPLARVAVPRAARPRTARQAGPSGMARIAHQFRWRSYPIRAPRVVQWDDDERDPEGEHGQDFDPVPTKWRALRASV